MANSIDLQTVLTQAMGTYRQHHALSPDQVRVSSHIRQCRTAALGGLVRHCNQCHYERPYYHSCRDRHCPKCQQQTSQQWCAKQQQKVLPVTYYHLVFTLPHDLNAWVQLHPQVIYGLLFDAVWQTLKTFGADPKRLGGQMGMSAVLHTWGQNLSRHVHCHCLVPGGALTATHQWRPAKSTYLFPVKALSRYFRGAMVSALRKANERGELHRITWPGNVDAVLNTLMLKDWVIYNKPYLKHAKTVVDYLGRYSHRIALSDSRLVGRVDDKVLLRYKDYADHKRHKVMALDPEELIRRFLQHVLPKGFMRIRHFGFLANRCQQAKLKCIRDSLATTDNPLTTARLTLETPPLSVANYPCPKCKTGRLQVCHEITPQRLSGG